MKKYNLLCINEINKDVFNNYFGEYFNVSMFVY